jgi:hypothetical protein
VRINVVVEHDWAIERTAEITGIAATKIREKFDECQKFGKPYVFNVDIDDAKLKALTDVKVGGDNGA